MTTRRRAGGGEAAARLSFLGAARNVTGSRYLVETPEARVLVDCGLYQERALQSRNWDPFPVPPASIDAVLLTHAHVDHCGYLPRLVRDGFRGRVLATPATAEIARIVLADSAKIQVEDAAKKKRRHERERRRGPHPEVPLYEPGDAEAAAALFEPAPYGAEVPVASGVTAAFRDAGHILGSSSVLLGVGAGAARRTVLFSGDVGRGEKPILRDPAPAAEADYVLVESTYGDRFHEEVPVRERLAEVVNAAREAGGNVIVPSFALERAQEILYHLNELLRAGRVPHLLVFLDSPMAVRVTDVFERHPGIVDAEMRALLDDDASPFRFPGLRLVRTVEQSKAINQIRGTAIIVAGSGMCTGGRVKHHLDANLGRRESTVLFVGYQAAGTLGRQILDGAGEVRLFGRMIPVRARVESIMGFSAHADRGELLRWLSGAAGRAPRRLFVTHGEPESAASFADQVRATYGWPVEVPEYGDRAVLD